MTPSHATKGPAKYRYYISSALVSGQAAKAGSINRIPAREIEAAVIKAVRAQRSLPDNLDDKKILREQIVRVEVAPTKLLIQLSSLESSSSKGKRKADRIEVPWQKTPSTRRREILVPTSTTTQNVRPIRSENRALLVASIARGRRWLTELMTDPTTSIAMIAVREQCSERKVQMTISLAWLAPDLVKAAVEGRLPRGMGVARLCELPPEWSRQHDVLGLPSPQS